MELVREKPPEPRFTSDEEMKFLNLTLQQLGYPYIGMREKLLENGIGIYTKDSIQKYREHLIAKDSTIICRIGIVLIVISFILSAVMWSPLYLLIAIPGFILSLFDPDKKQYWQYFHSYPLSCTKEKIPKNVLETALKVIELFPKAEIRVERVRQSPDRFLYVYDHGDAIYLEFWQLTESNNMID